MIKKKITLINKLLLNIVKNFKKHKLLLIFLLLFAIIAIIFYNKNIIENYTIIKINTYGEKTYLDENPHETNSTETNSTETNPPETNSTETNSTETNSTETNSTETESTETNNFSTSANKMISDAKSNIKGKATNLGNQYTTAFTEAVSEKT